MLPPFPPPILVFPNICISGDGEEPRHPTSPILGGAGHDGSRITGIWDGRGGEHTPPLTSLGRVAPKARPTIVKERPREAILVTNAAAEAR